MFRLKIEHANLQTQIEQLEKKNIDIMATFKEMEAKVREANAQRNLADQKYVSIEYEFDEYKRRFQCREQELLSQITECNLVDESNELKEKIKILTEKCTALESQLWQNENKYQSEIVEVETKLTAAIARCEQLNNLKDKHNSLQSEYNDLSDQVMDYISEIDKLKNAQSNRAELEERIAELQKQLDLERTENIAKGMLVMQDVRRNSQIRP